MAGSSLVPFHRVLIAAAIVFCAVLSWWMFSMTGQDDSTPYGVLGLVFVILAIVLAVYLWNLNRILGYREKDRR